MSCCPKIFSFFSGSGFLDLGFEFSNFDIAYVNEIFSPFMQAYQYSRAVLNMPLPEYGYHQGDVIQLTEGKPASNLAQLIQDARKHTNIIGFIGGPPCPDFSVGGKNRGGAGDNGKLSAAYIELICQQKPDFFLFENVKGLWKTTKHRVFYESLKYKLIQAGYILTERLINSLEYGVPQDRARIILIGFHKSLIKDLGIKLDSNNYYFSDGIFPWEKYLSYNTKQVFSLPWYSTTEFEENSLLLCPENILQELTIEYWFGKNDVLNHPNSQHYFQPRAGITKFAVIDEGDVSKKSYKRLHRWRYSPTACYGNNEVHLHPYKIRRISVAEALAIQSLPKDFVLPDNMTLTNMFKTIGNGVPYLAAKGIAETISEFLATTECQVKDLREKQLCTLKI